MEPYVFHCTPCGKPHAGDCPPKGRNGMYPAIGSVWQLELFWSKGWTRQFVKYEVLEFDGAESKTVCVHKVGGAAYEVHWIPVTAWDETGYSNENLGGMMCRLVEIR